MEIRSTIKNRAGQVLDSVYSEDDPLSDLEGKMLYCVHAYCFCGDKMVLVNHPKSGWMPPGGKIEEGESYQEAVVREVLEETNMKVLHHELIGFQDNHEPHRIVRQTRSFCIVEPMGDFVSDPDGEIMEIKLIDPEDHKKYFDWGEIGERMMERAMEMREKFK